MDIKDNTAIPVTDQQVNAFGKWIKDNYGGREEFEIALRNKDRRFIEYYFVHTLFSEEQLEVWMKSASFVGRISESPHSAQLQLYRRRLEIKISRTGAELVKRAFPKIEDNESASAELQLQRHTLTLQKEHYWQFRGIVPRRFVLHELTAEEVDTHIPVVCDICLSTHTKLDVCVTKCGHEFGLKCFREWEYTTCPTCSEFYDELIEFVAA